MLISECLLRTFGFAAGAGDGAFAAVARRVESEL